MRWVPAGSFDRICSPAALWAAWTRCRDGKRRRPDIARFDLDADQHVFALSRALCSGSWRPSIPRERLIHDPKTRRILVSSIRDRIVHRAIIDEVGPIYEASFIDQSFAAARGRGPQRAAIYALGQLRQHRYALVLDVSSYFASIQRDLLLGLYGRRLKDARTLGLLDLILGGEGKGIALGSYLSHFSGALYLDGLDHYVKRVWKVSGYLRYMDDFVLFHDDRAALESCHRELARWLHEQRGLSLKPAEVQPCGAGLDLLGYRLTRAGLAPGPKLLRRVAARLTLAAAAGPLALGRTVASYRGLVML